MAGGRPVSQIRNIRYSIRFHVDLWELLQKKAAEEGKRTSTYTASLLHNALQKAAINDGWEEHPRALAFKCEAIKGAGRHITGVQSITLLPADAARVKAICDKKSLKPYEVFISLLLREFDAN